MTKQTTIHLQLEEDIIGLNLLPSNPSKSRHEYTPTPQENQAWQLLTGGKYAWATGAHLAPKDNTPDDEAWWQSISDRILRVCAKRPFKTTVKILATFPNQQPRILSVTVFWQKPSPPPVHSKITPGTWTLREHPPGRKRALILTRFSGTLECDGDELYAHLDIDWDHYETDADINSVLVYSNSPSLSDYTFTFRRGKHKKVGSGQGRSR
jgi:hypothetical protein